MSDPEKTIPPAARYKEAEGWFDDVLTVLLRSPFTLAAFVLWTLVMVALGAVVAW